MTSVITVPPSLDDHSFETLLEQVAAHPPEARLIIDARHARWASPYGLTALLTLGQAFQQQGRGRVAFAVPEADDTASYWARTAFFRHADTVFELHGQVPRRPVGESSVLLEITPITQSGDVHSIIEKIQTKAGSILQGELHIDAKATMGFAMTLSEACQNIVEHAQTGGWVAVQTYKWAKRLGRRVVQIAVCDAGVGFRKSLESSQGRRMSDRWDDAMALEDAVIRAVSRFRDPGRGQGLAGIRKYVGRWDGKLSVRSGTARITIKPSWDDDVPLAENLPEFPGAQMQITIPERVPPK